MRPGLPWRIACPRAQEACRTLRAIPLLRALRAAPPPALAPHCSATVRGVIEAHRARGASEARSEARRTPRARACSRLCWHRRAAPWSRAVRARHIAARARRACASGKRYLGARRSELARCIPRTAAICLYACAVPAGAPTLRLRGASRVRSIFLPACATGSAAGAASSCSCSALQTRLRGGEGLPSVEQIVRQTSPCLHKILWRIAKF